MTDALDPHKPFVMSVVLVSGENVDLPTHAANVDAARSVAQDILGKARKGEPFELVPGYWVASDAVIGVKYRNTNVADMISAFTGTNQ